ncbi:MAG: HAD family hydrolase [Myxococcota bacterium]
MSDQPTIYLFDVDGTLITTGGVGRRALERTIAEVYGREDACDHFSFGGMTDRAIFRGGLTGIGEPATKEQIDGLIEAYIPILEDEVARAAHYAVHPGIVEALDALAGLDGVAVGLGTGNIERGARVKLERVGLNPHFGFGGFGCDDEARPTLIRAGALRGAERLGAPLEACRVVIIGDTPKDVHAAHSIGAEAVCVATGGSSFDDLVACGGDHVFPDLSAPGALDALLGRSSSAA